VQKKKEKMQGHKVKQKNNGRQPANKIKTANKNTYANPTETQVKEAIAKLVAARIANNNASANTNLNAVERETPAAPKRVTQMDLENGDADDESEIDAIQAIKTRQKIVHNGTSGGAGRKIPPQRRRLVCLVFFSEFNVTIHNPGVA
jgi:hypothetical protein